MTSGPCLHWLFDLIVMTIGNHSRQVFWKILYNTITWHYHQVLHASFVEVVTEQHSLCMSENSDFNFASRLIFRSADKCRIVKNYITRNFLKGWKKIVVYSTVRERERENKSFSDTNNPQQLTMKPFMYRNEINPRLTENTCDEPGTSLMSL